MIIFYTSQKYLSYLNNNTIEHNDQILNDVLYNNISMTIYCYRTVGIKNQYTYTY